jgi:hypothetical protein
LISVLSYWVQWSTTLCWAVWRCLADGESLVMAQGDPAHLTFALMEGYGVLQIPRQGGHTSIGMANWQVHFWQPLAQLSDHKQSKRCHHANN